MIHNLKYVAVAACVFTLTEHALAQNSQPIDPDPNRIALLWYRLSGTPVPTEEFVRQSSAYNRALEIDREQVFATEVEAIERDLSSMRPEEDTYVIRIPSPMTQYDPRSGGFFQPLFSGTSYVPIQASRYGSGRSEPLARGMLAGNYDLFFINPEDYVFWPMSEAEARDFMTKNGSRPKVTAEFHFRPIAAPAKPILDAKGGRVFGVVTKVDLKDRNNNTILSRGIQMTEAEARQQLSTARFKPSNMVQAMAFHKMMKAPEPDWATAAKKIQGGQYYSQDQKIAHMKAFYAALDETQPFTMLVASKFSGYDTADGRFPLLIDQPIEISSAFPYDIYPYAVAAYERDLEKAGRVRLVNKPTGTRFGVAFSNAGEIQGLDVDPNTATRMRADPSRDFAARAQLTVQPVSIEIVESVNGRSVSAQLNTRIAKARIYDKNSGQLLIERDYGLNPPTKVTVTEGREALGDFEGLDPYTIDFRGIKLGMTEAEMREAAKANFREVRTSPKFAPGYMKLFGSGENLGVTFCQDERICSLRYTRRFKENRVADVYQATIDKYGPLVGGRKPYDPMGRGREVEASMQWTSNFSRVGGVKGEISFFRGDKTTTLFMDAIDRSKKRKEKKREAISLD